MIMRKTRETVFTVLSCALVSLAGPSVRAEAASFEPLFDTSLGFETGDYTSSRFLYAARLGSLDGDDAPDVVVARWPWETGFAILRGRGDGSLGPPHFYPSTYPCLDVIMADVNSDQISDVIVSNTGYNYEGSTISVFLNLGDGSFAPQVQFQVGTDDHVAPVGLAAADFTGDGETDVAVAKYGFIGNGTTIALLAGDGAGGLSPPADFPAGDAPYKLASGDLNGDQRPDLIVANEGQELNVLINDGLGGFLPRVSYAVLPTAGGDFYPALELADADNDDDLDVFYASTRTWIGQDTGVIVLFRNDGSGNLGPKETIPLIQYTAGPVDLAVGDVNGDGWTDVIGAHFDGRATDGWELALNDGSGNFLPATLYPAGQQTVAVMTGDVDGDDEIDVLTADCFSMEVTVHINQGAGEFLVPPSYTVEPLSAALDAADIDKDGDLDILTSAGQATGTQASVLRNRGDGTFDPHVVYSFEDGVSSGKLRDLDGDTYPDIVAVTSNPPYDFITARNRGDGTFDPFIRWPVGSCGWGYLEAFDIDKDEDIDVVMAEYLACVGIPESGKRLFFARNRGDGTFDPPYFQVVDPNPYQLTPGDFNNDTRVDIGVANYGVYGANNWVNVLLGNGDGTFQPPIIYFVEFGPKDIIAADLNGDNNLDLATCNTGNGVTAPETMSVLMGNGNGTFQSPTTYFAPYSPDLLGATGILAGDPDNDDDIDLIVSSSPSNDVAFYRNSGEGLFETPVRYGANKGPWAPFYADFTGDQIEDIVVCSHLPPSGLFGAVSLLRGLTPSSAGAPEIPSAAHLGLSPCHPNPFAAFTTVRFALPEASHVTLSLFDVSGRRVATLLEGTFPAGPRSVTWDGRDGRGGPLASGTYLMRLDASGLSRTQKVIVQR